MDKQDNENENKNLQNKAVHHGLLARIKVLENENRELSTENIALQKELSVFRKMSSCSKRDIPIEKEAIFQDTPNFFHGKNYSEIPMPQRDQFLLLKRRKRPILTGLLKRRKRNIRSPVA